MRIDELRKRLEDDFFSASLDDKRRTLCRNTSLSKNEVKNMSEKALDDETTKMLLALMGKKD